MISRGFICDSLRAIIQSDGIILLLLAEMASFSGAILLNEMLGLLAELKAEFSAWLEEELAEVLNEKLDADVETETKTDGEAEVGLEELSKYAD